MMALPQSILNLLIEFSKSIVFLSISILNILNLVILLNKIPSIMVAMLIVKRKMANVSEIGMKYPTLANFE